MVADKGEGFNSFHACLIKVVGGCEIRNIIFFKIFISWMVMNRSDALLEMESMGFTTLVEYDGKAKALGLFITRFRLLLDY